MLNVGSDKVVAKVDYLLTLRLTIRMQDNMVATGSSHLSGSWGCVQLARKQILTDLGGYSSV